MASETSYTQATGKRPSKTDCGRWRWTLRDSPRSRAKDELCYEIFWSLVDGDANLPWIYLTEADALAACDAAYHRAVSEGVMKPIKPNP